MGHILALCGGVGGAKLAQGLATVLDGAELTVAVNTGDDFEHLGLHISPDLDTVLYTLSGLADAERGWGLAGETWGFMAALGRLGGETWFNLGDRDLATHVERTRRLAAGQSLSEITTALTARLGIAAALTPMSDQAVRTRVSTERGDLPFQRYFVEHRCVPAVRAIAFDGAAEAAPAPALRQAFERPDLEAILICPSNPYLSIDPILAVPGVRAALASRRVPCLAVSPLVGGRAVKGPTAKLMAELGITPGSAAIAAHYAGLIDALILDTGDAGDVAAVAAHGLEAPVTATLMHDLEDRVRLAEACLALAARAPGPNR